MCAATVKPGHFWSMTVMRLSKFGPHMVHPEKEQRHAAE